MLTVVIPDTYIICYNSEKINSFSELFQLIKEQEFVPYVSVCISDILYLRSEAGLFWKYRWKASYIMSFPFKTLLFTSAPMGQKWILTFTVINKMVNLHRSA